MVAVVDGRPVDDPATRAAVVRASQSVPALPHVVDVVNAYNASDPRLRATDGRASLIVVTLHETTDMATIKTTSLRYVRRCMALCRARPSRSAANWPR